MPWGAIAGSGWASGLNLYATVFILGLAGRLDWVKTPEAIQSTKVLVAVGLLYVVEFLVDKVPFLDSANDAVHTFIRPVGAAWLAAVMAGDSTAISQPLAALVAGGLALSSHSAKATTRAVANTSPEPFSNIALSVGEDGIVAAMMALVIKHQRIAGVAAVVAAIICVLITVKLFRMVRTIFRWLSGDERRSARQLATRP